MLRLCPRIASRSLHADHLLHVLLGELVRDPGATARGANCPRVAAPMEAFLRLPPGTLFHAAVGGLVLKRFGAREPRGERVHAWRTK